MCLFLELRWSASLLRVRRGPSIFVRHTCPFLCPLRVRGPFDVYVFCPWRHVQRAEGWLRIVGAAGSRFCVDLTANGSPPLNASACPGINTVPVLSQKEIVLALISWQAAWRRAVFCWATLHKRGMFVPAPSLSIFLLMKLPSYPSSRYPRAWSGDGILQPGFNGGTKSCFFLLLQFIFYSPQESWVKGDCQKGKRWKQCSVTV